uniref:BTB domain-containing protein n=2 Tax=Globodera pallida TaxID=36090 RepID=A0A183C559_GLOPA
MANIYDEFIIVEEKSMSDLAIQKASDLYTNSQFNDLTAFAALEFKMKTWSQCLQIKDIASHSTNASGPLAQIDSWKWEGGTQKIEKPSHSTEAEQRRSIAKIHRLFPCPPLSSPNDDLTIHIGDRQVTVSANWLMVISPVVKRMLSVEMKEKQQRTLNLNGHDITMEQFMQFLETVNDHLRHGRTLPNPTNVLYLLELADYFQIDWLKERCDAQLINCIEIPLIERFLLIDRYRLNNLKNFFLHCLNADKLKEFLRANHEQQLLSDASIDKKSWFELTIRFCAKP